MGAVRQSGTIFRRSSDGLWIGKLEAGWNANGGRRKISVASKSEAECRRKLIAKRRELEAGALVEGVATSTSVKAWSADWLEARSHDLSPNTFRNYTSVVRRWIIPTIGRKRLDRLTPADLRAVTHEQDVAGVKSSTSLFTRRVLVKMLRDAALEGHRVPERLFHVRAPIKNSNDRDAIPTADAVELLRAAVDLPDGSRWIVGFLQGLRQGEALGLTWDHVDLERGLIDIEWQLDSLPYLDRAAGTFRTKPGEPVRRLAGAFHLVPVKTKAGRRVVPIIEEVADALRQWREIAPESPSGLVWPRADGRPRGSKSDTAQWVRLQDAAQVASFDGREGRRYLGHEIRHTTATLLLEAGVDPKTVEAILGHSSIVTSRGYQHVSQELARDALSRVATKLSLTGSRPALDATK